MEYEEERHARALYGALSRAFEPVPDIRVTVTGEGVHWACVSTRGDKSCSVSCFDLSGPEYLTSFDRGDETAAWGRTASQADTVAAVARWLDGDEVTELRDRFEFVDRNRRALSAVAEEVVRLRPGLRGTAEVRHQMCDLNELWFAAGDRTCAVSYYGDNAAPDAAFHWDGCEMFQFRADDPAALAPVLDRWLVERLAPSAMATTFPWLDVRPVARAYEEGRGVEGEFLGSWDAIEQFYRELNWPLSAPVLALIADIRRAGYDRTLRAGQSLSSLLVSRSRRHGLRDGQSFIAFDFRRSGMSLHVHVGGVELCSFPAVALTPQVEALLGRLAAEDVD